ncbi:MAG: cobalamin-independent methionine synthase II family protein [Marinosulfonomonas sp.]|nr:cobalamin-independent methionine synthase II family protein [Marinosulfonomonas sp.]
MPIKTTCIGAFPKPDYVPIKDWFKVVHADDSYTTDVVHNWSDDPKHEPAFERATREAVQVQIDCGIDIPTDGEQRRENYVHYQCRYFDGFDFDNLEHRVLRNGAYESDLPAIRGKISAGQSVLPRDYSQAQGFCDRPVKLTLPGPMTIIGTVADCFYNDDKQLAFDLADALNQEVRALADAGCIHIQIDEPLFARKPDDAAAFGYEALERVFHGVPDHVMRTSHMCCGYPEHIDQPEYPKADHNVYHQLLEALDGKIDALSIEDCHCHSDLSLFEKFTKTIAIVGFVDIAVSEIEPVEQIAARMREVLTVLPPERLMAAPDCGLGFLTLEQTRTKLTNMCKAAAMV